MDAVDQVVGVHDRVDVALGDGGFKGRQVDLAQGALVDVGADVVAVVLLVVHGIVLDGGDDALGLHPLNVRNHQAGVEEGILGEVFEVAAGDGRAGDVDPWAEQEVDTAGSGILAQALAQLAGELRVPGGGQGDAARVGGGGSPGADADRGIGHLEAGQIDGRQGMGVHTIDAAQQIDFLFQGEFGHQGVGFGLDVG